MKQIESINEGWKACLNVPETLESPGTKALADFCDKHKIPYKIGNADQEGKGFTAYLGSRTRLDAFAKAVEPMQEHIENMVGTALTQNMPVGESGKLYARFHPVHYKGEPMQLARYGSDGLPFTPAGQNKTLMAAMKKQPISKDFDAANEWRTAFIMLERIYGEVFTGVPQGQTPEWAKSYFPERVSTEEKTASGFDDFLKQRVGNNRLTEALRKTATPLPENKTGFDMMLAGKLKEGQTKS